jgi:hypothetical protein
MLKQNCLYKQNNLFIKVRYTDDWGDPESGVSIYWETKETVSIYSLQSSWMDGRVNGTSKSWLN